MVTNSGSSNACLHWQSLDQGQSLQQTEQEKLLPDGARMLACASFLALPPTLVEQLIYALVAVALLMNS